MRGINKILEDQRQTNGLAVTDWEPREKDADKRQTDLLSQKTRGRGQR